MAPGGPRPALLLLLALLAAGRAQRVAPSVEFLRFVREHIDSPKSSPRPGQGYCEFMVRSLGLPCPASHTFLHVPPGRLRAVCSRAETCRQPWECDSRAPYPLTTCRLLFAGHLPLRCLYQERDQTRRLRLACNRLREPVRILRLL
ncbi:ribonuclease-like [Pelodiscus sinensis]|uniref:ribonuclease-like n=1 Tax=Pelodiscus sinensis TaxID=13735 RepID=UPI003F6C3E87